MEYPHSKKETEDAGEDWVELEAFLYRGITYYELGEYKNAIEDFKRIKKYFSYSAEAKFYWAKCEIAL